MIETADVVVIGGGVIGAACAEALSRRWPQVILIERQGLASGTSSACQSGVGHGLFADDYDLLFDRAAIDEYQALVADGAQVDYEKTRALLVCTPAEAEQVKARLPYLNELGFDCEWLDEQSLYQAEPNLGHGYAGAARLNDMGQVSPMRLVVELTHRARQRGAQIYTDTEVISIALTHGRVTAVQTNTRRIATERVVIAAGVWSRHIGKLLNLDVPVWPLKGHVLVTEPLRGTLNHYITEAEYEVGVATIMGSEMTPDGPKPGTPQAAAVLQPLPSGQILIGSSREFAGYDREVNRERLAQVARRASKVVPLLGQRRIIRTYAGLRPWTADGRPLIGPTEQVPGVTFATGHSGEGNTRSLITGRLVAALMAGSKPPLDPDPISPDRFALRMAAAAV